jgi:response regulator RpfG family c-di-GMP phosphodiesterase
MENFNQIDCLEILMVDDDQAIQLYHFLILKKLNLDHKAKKFFNGKKALEYIIENDDSSKKYIVFLDINMPVMNGWEFLVEIEKVKIHSSLQVFMLSSSIDSNDEKKSKTYKIVKKFLRKPLSTNLIREAIESPNLF